jgi:EAL domain-containing protein (putative c-di-GMP-specific phosphodiesterase class I)
MAVIGVARGLNLRVVAEGIETPEEVAFLTAHHCDEGQGEYFGRPLSGDPFAALLAGPAREGVLMREGRGCWRQRHLCSGSPLAIP